MTKIKDIPLNDRPMERLINQGVDALSNEELLAVLLKTGTKKYSSKEVATNLLSKTSDIQNLKNINYFKLKEIDGIGRSKACTILAAIELGCRVNKEILNINLLKITSAGLVYKYYKDIIGFKEQEYFICIYLNNNKIVIKDKILFIGTLNHSIVHPREIFKEAYLVGASSIICIHNHPSGNTMPSSEDFEITEKLVNIGILLGIKIDDHIIIGKHNYYSFFENGDIN